MSVLLKFVMYKALQTPSAPRTRSVRPSFARLWSLSPSPGDCICHLNLSGFRQCVRCTDSSSSTSAVCSVPSPEPFASRLPWLLQLQPPMFTLHNLWASPGSVCFQTCMPNKFGAGNHVRSQHSSVWSDGKLFNGDRSVLLLLKIIFLFL